MEIKGYIVSYRSSLDLALFGRNCNSPPFGLEGLVVFAHSEDPS
jgi:hypothetical protein